MQKRVPVDIRKGRTDPENALRSKHAVAPSAAKHRVSGADVSFSFVASPFVAAMPMRAHGEQFDLVTTAC